MGHTTLTKGLANLQRGAWVASMALLAACGGEEEPAAPPASVVLSALNEPTLSAAAVQEITSIQQVAGLSGSVDAGQAAIERVPVKRVLAAAVKTRKVGVLANESFEIECAGGGKIDLVFTDDLKVFKATFVACVEDGETVDGSVTLTVVSVTPDGLKEELDIKLDLVLTRGGTVDKVFADLRLTDDGSIPGQETVVITSPLQSLQRSANGQVQSSRTLRDLQLTSVLADSGQRVDSFSFNSEGSLALLGATAYKVETLTALTTPPGAIDPVSGQVKVTVGGKGIILLTAEADSVRVQADAEGDGVFEVDRRQTWSSLAGTTP